MTYFNYPQLILASLISMLLPRNFHIFNHFPKLINKLVEFEILQKCNAIDSTFDFAPPNLTGLTSCYVCRMVKDVLHWLCCPLPLAVQMPNCEMTFFRDYVI